MGVVALWWFLLAGVPAQAQPGTVVQGRVLDPDALVLPGVTVTFVSRSGAAQTVVTDGEGRYRLDMSAGIYDVRAELDGFAPAFRQQCAVGPGEVTLDLELGLATVAEQVTVTAQAPLMVASETAQPVTVSREIIDNAALPSGRFEDVLPLVPTVVRGPDGLISMAGARPVQGSLLVNGGRETDPVSGEYGVLIPIDALSSVETFTTGYSAEFGQSTGGVARVRTRSGTDSLRLSINSFIPRLRFDAGKTHGIESWTPHFGVSGPVVKGKVWFAQSFDFSRVRSELDTAQGEQDSRLNAITSMSQIDMRPTASHELSVSANIGRRIIDDANLNWFNPMGTVPRFQTTNWSLALQERATLNPSTFVESGVHVKRFDATLTSRGEGAYTMGHEQTVGRYFNEQDRTAYRTEVSTVVSRVGTGRVGPTLLRVGAAVDYVTYTGTNVSAPVRFLRADGSLARFVTFSGTPETDGSATEYGAFITRHSPWTRSLDVEFGIRLDGSSLADHPIVAPRLEWVWTGPDQGRTTVKGGGGVFADRLVLGARTFSQQQSRTVQRVFADGSLNGAARVYTNAAAEDLSLPWAGVWNIQLAHRFGMSWLVRTDYRERYGRNELVVTPEVIDETSGVMTLRQNGTSTSRGLETTVGFVQPDGHQVYVSYVRSSATGNMNDLNSIEGNFKEAFVRDDADGPLRFDVPHRFLAWAVFQLPSRTTLAPFFEMRSGFPFSAIDDEWNYVGSRNGRRLPTFASLDVVVNTWVDLPVIKLPARLGFKIYNLVGTGHGRDVQSNIVLGDFGVTHNPVRRQFRGTFEVSWGGSRRAASPSKTPAAGSRAAPVSTR
jgi:hypothetical protein